MPGPVPAPARAIAKHLIRRYNPRHLKHFSMRRRPAPLEAASINGPQGPQFFGEVSMAQQLIELKATARPRAGKGAARQARREGKVPAVIYGNGETPLTIVLDYNDLWKQVIKGHFTSTVIDVDVDGKKSRVIPRDLQVDPVKDQPIHVDFMRIGKDGRIRVEVPVRFINDQQSPGLKRGGVLNVVRHDIEVICPYDHIPPYFEIDLTGLEIGRSIHISAVTLPKDAELTIKDRDFTIATIAGAVKQEEETPTAAAAAAPAEGAAAAPAAGDKGAAAAKGAAPAAAKGGAAAPAAKGAAPAAKKK
jgi:large subunit ribosomal protein L25